MQQTYGMRRVFIACPLLSIMLPVFLVLTAMSPLSMGHAMTPANKQNAHSSCPAVGAITSQSLLVVLLDRSGSLTYEPGATDPDGYSTSVTKALADLWPGSMAVIPFSNDTTPVLGPVNLADQGQRDNLKNQVQNYPIGGDTPLAPALHKAFDLLKNAASGSRAIIVTDGNPDPDVLNGVNQVDDIHKHLIPQFCAQGTPVSAFGLVLDLTQPTGQAADHLLHDIATGTDGVYTNVRNSQDLAQVVVKLYADWQHLLFVLMQARGNNYSVPIDTYAKKVSFVTFRTDSRFKVTVFGPSGQPLPDQVVQRSTDRHYEIDGLVLSDVNQPGSYTVNASGDGKAQAYALVETRLHVVLNQPTARTVAHIGQPLQIEAELYNDSTPVVPQPNEVTVNAHVTLVVNGQTVSNQDVELVQASGSPLFTRQITLPGPVGQVKIEIRAVYRQVPVEASGALITIPLGPRIVIRKPVPPLPPCGTNLQCYWQPYSTAIRIGGPLILLLSLLLLWLLQKGPYGVLQQNRQKEVLRKMSRPFLRLLLHKSVLSSQELERAGFNFGGSQFDLVFKRGVIIRARSDIPSIMVKSGNSSQPVKQENKDGVDLTGGDVIRAGTYSATYLDEAQDPIDEIPRTRSAPKLREY